MVRIKEIRLKNYNYKSDGYYFVTTVCDKRKEYLIKQEYIVEEQLKDLAVKTPGLLLDYFVVMPNHVHIIFILQNCQLPLGEVVRRFKSKASRALGTNVWQPNYYEHVIRNEKALEKIRQYIINNPQGILLEFDQFYK